MTSQDLGTGAAGRCQCGGVQFTVSSSLNPVLNCHCHRCRQFTGHYMAATSAPSSTLHFTADKTLTWYEPDPTVAYGFCSTCGSSLFWRASERPEETSICAGILEQPTGLTTTQAWWMTEHGDYHEPATGLIEYLFDGP
jgi:hypothetical protein